MLPVRGRSPWLSPTFEEPVSLLRNEVDSLFNQFFGNDGGSLSTTWSSVPIAMWEDEDQVYIEADLPGLAESDVDVSVHNGLLFIQGQRRPEPERRYLYNGRTYGRFERVIALPASVDVQEVKAQLASGVLHIELSKAPESKPKKITLQKT